MCLFHSLNQKGLLSQKMVREDDVSEQDGLSHSSSSSSSLTPQHAQQKGKERIKHESIFLVANSGAITPLYCGSVILTRKALAIQLTTSERLPGCEVALTILDVNLEPLSALFAWARGRPAQAVTVYMCLSLCSLSPC